MVSILVIDSKGSVKVLKAKDLTEGNVFKKAGFRTAENFQIQHTWNISATLNIVLWGKSIGKGTFINSYKFPAPIDNISYYGTCVLTGMNVSGYFVDLEMLTWSNLIQNGVPHAEMEDNVDIEMNVVSDEAEDTTMNNDTLLNDDKLLNDDAILIDDPINLTIVDINDEEEVRAATAAIEDDENDDDEADVDDDDEAEGDEDDEDDDEGDEGDEDEDLDEEDTVVEEEEEDVENDDEDDEEEEEDEEVVLEEDNDVVNPTPLKKTKGGVGVAVVVRKPRGRALKKIVKPSATDLSEEASKLFDRVEIPIFLVEDELTEDF
jgi:hypothetical protein